MSRRFVIITEDIDGPQADEITSFFELMPKTHFWHWVDNVWLVYSEATTLTLEEMRGHILASIGERIQLMLFEVASVSDWVAWANPEMGPWLKTFWGPVDPSPASRETSLRPK